MERQGGKGEQMTGEMKELENALSRMRRELETATEWHRLAVIAAEDAEGARAVETVRVMGPRVPVTLGAVPPVPAIRTREELEALMERGEMPPASEPADSREAFKIKWSGPAEAQNAGRCHLCRAPFPKGANVIGGVLTEFYRAGSQSRWVGRCVECPASEPAPRETPAAPTRTPLTDAQRAAVDGAIGELTNIDANLETERVPAAEALARAFGRQWPPYPDAVDEDEEEPADPTLSIYCAGTVEGGCGACRWKKCQHGCHEKAAPTGTARDLPTLTEWYEGDEDTCDETVRRYRRPDDVGDVGAMVRCEGRGEWTWKVWPPNEFKVVASGVAHSDAAARNAADAAAVKWYALPVAAPPPPPAEHGAGEIVDKEKTP